MMEHSFSNSEVEWPTALECNNHAAGHSFPSVCVSSVCSPVPKVLLYHIVHVLHGTHGQELR